MEEPIGPTEICDACGAVIDPNAEFYSFVRDSSVVHRVDPQFDGQRLVVACSRAHLQQVRDEYARRPWVDEELWAGQLDRALTAAGGQSSTEHLAAETGLTPTQIRRAAAWKNAEAVKFWRDHPR